MQVVRRAGLWRGERLGSVGTHIQLTADGHAGRTRALLVRVRRSGFEAATSPPWPETLAVVEAVLPRWPSLSKRTTCQGWRAGERGEQAGAQAQPRARTLSPHGQPVSRAGSEKVLATGHRFENTRQDSQPRGLVFSWKLEKGAPAQCGTSHWAMTHPAITSRACVARGTSRRSG